jgi:hypothetical protein
VSHIPYALTPHPSPLCPSPLAPHPTLETCTCHLKRQGAAWGMFSSISALSFDLPLVLASTAMLQGPLPFPVSPSLPPLPHLPLFPPSPLPPRASLQPSTGFPSHSSMLPSLTHIKCILVCACVHVCVCASSVAALGGRQGACCDAHPLRLSHIRPCRWVPRTLNLNRRTGLDPVSINPPPIPSEGFPQRSESLGLGVWGHLRGGVRGGVSREVGEEGGWGQWFVLLVSVRVCLCQPASSHYAFVSLLCLRLSPTPTPLTPPATTPLLPVAGRFL